MSINISLIIIQNVLMLFDIKYIIKVINLNNIFLLTEQNIDETPSLISIISDSVTAYATSA